MTDYIERDMLLKMISHKPSSPTTEREDRLIDGFISAVKNCPAADVVPVPEGGIGEMSDGYHTFNGLYYQRMVLFAALVRAFRGKAWKSWKHEDGEPCFGGGWFIVGIDTPQGSYTYHYDKMYWNLFECEELPTAKHWDGHTEEDVTRLLTLECGLSRKNYKPQTNADRIRSMTDDELADWLGVYCNGQTAQEVGKPCVSGMGSCEECWLDWLRQEGE